MNYCSNTRESYSKLQRSSYNFAPSVKHAITYNSASESRHDIVSDAYMGRTDFVFYQGAYGTISGQTAEQIGGKIKERKIYTSQNDIKQEQVTNYSLENIETIAPRIIPTAGDTDIEVCLDWSKNSPYSLSISDRNYLGECYTNSTSTGFQLASYSHYSAQRYTRYRRRLKLNSVVTTDHFDDNKSKTNIVSYFYNNSAHNRPIRQETTSSNGSVLKTETVYSEDVISPDAVIQKLNSLHRISEPIEVKGYKKISITAPYKKLSHLKTMYKQWTTDKVFPEFIQTSKGTQSSEDKIIYHSYYANGNVKEVSKKDGTHLVYIWGYNEKMPIAMIENATYTQVSSYVSNLQNLSNLDSEASSETNLRNALNSMRTSLISAIPNAQVTTYTYNPLVGVTSITDLRGKTVYYQYDSFNRLEQVKDHDGNILSATQYNYKN